MCHVFSFVMYIMLFLCMATSCVCSANPADAYTASEGMYIGTFGRFNDFIGDSWEQVSPYGWRVHPISGDSRFHQGVDISAEYGTSLYALGDGFVKEAGNIDPSGYGLLVTVHYPWALAPDGSAVGMDVMYAHLAAHTVYAGDTVRKGQTIAFLGSSGSSTGPHVHMEVSYGNSLQTVDPALYFSDLTPGSFGNGSGQGLAMDRMPSFNIELKADLVKPIREIIETIVKAATAGLQTLADGIKSLFAILITIDLAIALIFYNLDKNMHEKTPLFAYLAFKFLFYGFLLFFLTHWGDFVGNLSKDLFSEAAAIMSNRTPDEVAAAISSPTDVIAKGLHIVSPIFTQALKDSGTLLGFGIGIVLCLGALILLLFFIIGWHMALAYIEFYLMILFGFTTFIFAGEKHTRIHAENGINGIIASAINLMFFCFFAITLQGMMADLAVDSVFTVGGRAGQEFTYQHPGVNDPDNAGIPPGANGLTIFMSKIRAVESYGGHYYCYCDPRYAVDSETYGAYQVLNSANWNQWAEEYIQDTNNNPPLDTDFSLVPTTGFDAAFHEGPPPSTYNYPATPRNQDLICGHKMLRLYEDRGNWRGVAEFWSGDNTGEYWQKVSGASAADLKNTPPGRIAINTFVLLKLFLLILLFMVVGDKVSQAVMNSFGSRGFTFRMNS